MGLTKYYRREARRKDRKGNQGGFDYNLEERSKKRGQKGEAGWV